jgi:hypothetical protein
MLDQAPLFHFRAQFASPFLDAHFERKIRSFSFVLLAPSPVAKPDPETVKCGARNQREALDERNPIPHHLEGRRLLEALGTK